VLPLGSRRTVEHHRVLACDEGQGPLELGVVVGASDPYGADSAVEHGVFRLNIGADGEHSPESGLDRRPLSIHEHQVVTVAPAGLVPPLPARRPCRA